MTIELAGGFAIATSFTFSDPAEATKRAGELQQQLDSMKGGIVGFGMPQGVLDSVRIVAAGPQLLVHLSASEADLRSMRQRLGPMLTP